MPHVWESLAHFGENHLENLNQDDAPTKLFAAASRPMARVLDVGCFCGAMAKAVKEKFPGAHVTGVEPLAKAAKKARAVCDKVIAKSFEKIDWEKEGIAPRSFDTIILGDVLEHMYDPWSALLKMHDLLTDDGQILASIPNIRNLSTFNELANGTWTYTPIGILDITHIRFFTRHEIVLMFEQTGYTLDSMKVHLDGRFAGVYHKLEEFPTTLQFENLIINVRSKDELAEYCALQFGVCARKNLTTPSLKIVSPS